MQCLLLELVNKNARVFFSLWYVYAQSVSADDDCQTARASSLTKVQCVFIHFPSIMLWELQNQWISVFQYRIHIPVKNSRKQAFKNIWYSYTFITMQHFMFWSMKTLSCISSTVQMRIEAISIWKLSYRYF